MSTVTNSVLKHQKVCDAAENVVAVADRISDLPDSLLCSILKFLPTKQSVLTSILSKRWRLIWTKVPTLSFDYNLHPSHDKDKSFVHFVNTVLMLRGTAGAVVPIKQFSLKCDNFSGYQFTICTWVTAATRYDVEQLHLSLPKFTLPTCVLSCKTLVALRVDVSCLGDISIVHLPSLKKLCLEASFPRFYDNFHVTKLLSGCPILEKLMVFGSLIGQKLLSEHLQFQMNLSNLVKAKLIICYSQSECQELMLYLLKKLYDVKHLSLSPSIMQSLAYAVVNDTLVFYKLSHLQLVIYDGFSWDTLIRLLQNSPQLEVLLINEMGSRDRLDAPIMDLHPVPKCISLSLGEVMYRSFFGNEFELEFARYFLENAKFLKVMKIYSAVTLNAETKLQNLQKLSSFPRSSEKCQLLFY